LIFNFGGLFEEGDIYIYIPLHLIVRAREQETPVLAEKGIMLKFWNWDLLEGGFKAESV